MAYTITPAMREAFARQVSVSELIRYDTAYVHEPTARLSYKELTAFIDEHPVERDMVAWNLSMVGENIETADLEAIEWSVVEELIFNLESALLHFGVWKYDPSAREERGE